MARERGERVDYSERIPNNVGLAENRRLLRALEEWQPRFLDWWQEMGPLGFQTKDVYLRTAISVIQRRGEARDRAVGLLDVKVRGRVLGRHGVLARDQQNRAAIAVGLRDGSEGRLAARAVLRHARSDSFAVRRSREAVRDVHRHTLRARDDRTHTDQRGRIQQPILGEAYDELGALPLQQLHDAISDEHLRLP